MKRFFLFVFLLLSSHLSATYPKIIVVGAGLSGLTTAYRLQRKGFDVEVFEARGRVGGRVFTVNVNDHLAELGGQNIKDGGDAINLLHLAAELGLETEERKGIFKSHYFENGKMIDVFQCIKERNFIPEKLCAELQTLSHQKANMQEVLQAFFGEHDILYKICSVGLAAYEGATVDKLSSLYITTLYFELLGGYSSTHPGDQEGGVSHQWIKGGNSLLAEKLSAKLYPQVHLNQPLASIAKNPQGYNLTFRDGTKKSADILILTIPCPVFENIQIADEVIPLSKQKAIASIQYGTNAKILVPITPPDPDCGSYMNNRMVSFLNNDRYVINLYYIGEYGKFSQQTIGSLFQKDLPLISRVYSLQSSQKLVTARDVSFACYNGPVGHSWPNDPFAKGSYSCIGAGQEELFLSTMEVEGEIVKTLFAPIDNTLFFSGEHTTLLFDAIGTMEAAVESGERMARLVEKCLCQ